MDLYLEYISEDVFFGLTPFEQGIVGAFIYGIPSIIPGFIAVICAMPLILFNIVCSSLPLSGIITSMPFCCLPVLLSLLCIGIISELVGVFGAITLCIGETIGLYKGLTHNLVERLVDLLYNLITT